MKNLLNSFSDVIHIGDIFEISIPLYQMPIGTLIVVYRIEKNGIHYLSEENITFYMGNFDNSWNSLQFLQRSGINYQYVESEFKSDLNAAYFKLLFFKFKRLDRLN